MAKVNNTELYIDGNKIDHCIQYTRTIGCENIEAVTVTFYPLDVSEITNGDQRQIRITTRLEGEKSDEPKEYDLRSMGPQA